MNAMEIIIDKFRLGANLENAIEMSGRSKADIARQAGIHRTTIDPIMDGRALGQLKTFLMLCGAIGVEPGKMLEGVVRKK